MLSRGKCIPYGGSSIDQMANHCKPSALPDSGEAMLPNSAVGEVRASSRTVCLYVYAGSLIVFVATIFGGLVAGGQSLGQPLTVGTLALAALVAQRSRIRVASGVEQSLALLPTLCAAVLFGSLAALVVGGASMLVELRPVSEVVCLLMRASPKRCRNGSSGERVRRHFSFTSRWYRNRSSVGGTHCRDRRRALGGSDIPSTRKFNASDVGKSHTTERYCGAVLRKHDRSPVSGLPQCVVVDPSAFSAACDRSAEIVRSLPRSACICGWYVGCE